MYQPDKSFAYFFPLEFKKNQVKGLAIILAILIIFLSYYANNYPLLLALIPTLFGGFIWQPLLYIPAFFWFGVSNFLGYISSKIILTFTFLLFVIPVGFIRNLAGKDNLMINNNVKSTFRERNHTFQPEDLENPF